MTTPINRNYIDSHWLVFAVQGALALLFGWLMLFNPSSNTSGMVTLVAVFLLAMGIVELFNALHREHNKSGWAVTLIIAAIDLAIALSLIFTIQENAAWHLTLIAMYTLVRGIIEILIGLKVPDDSTDRFIWIICGICGAIMGVVIFNSGLLREADFVRFFGAYMLILGTSSLIYGIHNRAQKLEAKITRAKSSKKRTSSKKKK
ncbi:DUF308 domain-containing protein [Candidatus Saccharibacteria bacterium]|nr:DUF308 domain-containing protein [Candidatus Saccharibacteria bacterium]